MVIYSQVPMNATIQDAAVQVMAGLGLVVAAIALAAWQRLGLTGNIILATGRTLLQLVVLGFILTVVLTPPQSPGLTAFMAGVLVLVATIVTRNRISQTLPQLFWLTLGALCVSTGLTVAYVQWCILPASVGGGLLIPLVGIVLSHSMSAAAIAGDGLVSSLKSQTLAIETHLSLGATPQQAIAPYRQAAVRSALLPVLNLMTIVALATLPELMGAQLLGGTPPIQATLWQILVLFITLFSSLLTTLLLTQGISRQFFNPAAQFVRPI
jgi:putative ABC transport system permease protein